MSQHQNHGDQEAEVVVLADVGEDDAESSVFPSLRDPEWWGRSRWPILPHRYQIWRYGASYAAILEQDNDDDVDYFQVDAKGRQDYIVGWNGQVQSVLPPIVFLEVRNRIFKFKNAGNIAKNRESESQAYLRLYTTQATQYISI